ncbi:MAG: class I SAM-dependent methyltransferase [Armatimonadota bacterium]|jgi:ubiquinone/menaquinone biosynthesis C-methylase UbiE
MQHRKCTHRLIGLTIAVAVLATVPTAAQRKGKRSRDDWQRPEQVVAELHLQPGAVVADIGCGTGYFTFRLAEAVGEAGKIIGVDIDEKALATLKKRAAERGAGNIELVQSEPTDTKLEPASVDVAFVCMVMHHVPKEQQEPLLGSIAQAVKPGGYLYVIDVRRDIESHLREHGEKITRAELIEKAEAGGLKLDADFYCLPYQYFVRFLRPETEQ